MSHDSLRVWGLMITSLAITGAVRADVVRLRNGGEVRGQIQNSAVQNSPGKQKFTSIQTPAGTLVTIAQDEIDSVERRSPLYEEYVTRSRTLPQTVEARWELAEWCRSNRLLTERKEQLERLLELDPDHEQARKILGYVKNFGHWITHEDDMARRGYIRYEGRWVTRQELELKQANSAQHEAELAWVPKVRIWLIWLTSNDAKRATKGLTEFQKIQDPNAISALVKMLSRHENQDIRMLFVNILGQIKGPRPVGPLVDKILFDGSHFVRNAALQALSPERYSLALPALIAALKHKMNPVICRAAEALAEIGDERAVPALIDALVTSHAVQVQVPANQGVTFSGNIGNRAFSGIVPPEVEIASRTGQLPYGVGINSIGPPVQMKNVTVAKTMKNIPVLEALEKMTGNNFGFNERDWHLWWAIQKG